MSNNAWKKSSFKNVKKCKSTNFSNKQSCCHSDCNLSIFYLHSLYDSRQTALMLPEPDPQLVDQLICVKHRYITSPFKWNKTRRAHRKNNLPLKVTIRLLNNHSPINIGKMTVYRWLSLPLLVVYPDGITGPINGGQHTCVTPLPVWPSDWMW